MIGEVLERLSPRWRQLAPVMGLVVVLVVLSVLFARAPGGSLPLDPTSTRPDGTKALTLVLQRLGADVRILAEPADADVDVVLVLVDNLNDATASTLRDHARRGGRLVVADGSGLLGQDLVPVGSAAVGVFDATLQRRCALPAVQDAASVRVGQSPLFDVPEGAIGCYRRGDGAWLVVREEGQGTLVVAGGPAFLTNALLGDRDNAILAAALLAPRPGTRVGIVAPDFRATDAEEMGLLDLIPLAWRLAALQLVIAFVVFVLWRGRRLGKPVAETPQVRLPGSDLVIAVGHLYQRTGAAAHAAELLRHDIARSIAQRLGVGHDDVELLASVAAERTTATREEVLDVLAGPLPQSEGELVMLAQRAEELRHAMTSPVTSGVIRVDR